MATEQKEKGLKPNSGALWDNFKSQPKHPDMRGELCMPDGTLMEVGAWWHSGCRRLTLSLRPKREGFPPGGEESQQADDGSIPF